MIPIGIPWPSVRKWSLVEKGVWKAIDRNGNILGEATYDEVFTPDSENLMKVRKNERYGIANSEGKFIAEPKYEIILGQIICNYD